MGNRSEDPDVSAARRDMSAACTSPTPTPVSVALLYAEDAAWEHLARQTEGTAERQTKLGFVGREYVGARIGLVAQGGLIRYIAGLQRELVRDDISRAFDLEPLCAIDPPLEVGELKSILQRSQWAPLEGTSRAFTRNASSRVIDLLLDRRPDLAPLIWRLAERPLEVLAERQELSREATANAIAFTGLNRDALDEEDIVPREKTLIERDAHVFMEWRPDMTETLGVRKFSDGLGRTLKVMDVDRTRLEGRLGPDLVYYHVQRESFVLVQYKRMIKEKTWVYRARADFDRQLQLMARIDDLCLDAEGIPGLMCEPGDFRLASTPSYVKVCKQPSHRMDPMAMVEGLCMPRAQVQAYLNKGRSLSYEMVKDSMNSTAFAHLVALGLIGSSRRASHVVREQIRDCLGPVVFAEFDDPLGERPGRRSDSRRRRSP